MDNYIVINGKKAELTKEQLETLGILTNPFPFGVRSKGEKVYYINEYGRIGAISSAYVSTDRMDKVANIFNDSKYADNVALHQTLYRQLLKFRSEIADEGETRPLFYILYDSSFGDCRVAPILCSDEARHFGEVYFSTAENAMRAIKEVVRPFLKAHPCFKWTI